MPATAVKLGMNITTSDYGQYVTAYKAQQRKLAAAAPTVRPQQFSLSSPMVGRIHNVRPGCGSCGK